MPSYLDSPFNYSQNYNGYGTPYYSPDRRPMDYINGSPVNADSITGGVPNGQVLDPTQEDPAYPIAKATPTNMIGKLFPQGVNLQNVYDLGRLGIGLSGAMQETPTWARPNNWNSYLGRMEQASHQGFTPAEASLAHQNAINSYASDIANINNAGGGNAGTILGNYGRAAGSLYHNQADMATRDAELQRQNLAAYGGALGQDVGYGRQIYEDNLRKIMQNKQSGAALANDALYNMNGRADRAKQYGQGSIYDEYMKELLKEKQLSNQNLALTQQHMKGGYNPYVQQTLPIGDNSGMPPVDNSYMDTRDPNALPFMPAYK